MNDQPTTLKSPVEKLQDLHAKIDTLIGQVTTNGAMSMTVAETIKIKLEDVIGDLNAAGKSS